MIFYRVVSATFQVFGDIGPPIFELTVLKEKDPLLLIGPVDFLDLGIQMVVPPFPALLTLATRQLRCDSCPALGAMLEHHLQDFLVFLLGPGTLYRLHLVATC